MQAMRTPRMEQDDSQNGFLTASQPNQQDYSGPRRNRSNSFRDQAGSDKEGPRSRASSSAKSDANSDTSRLNKARGPINDAVLSAVNPIDPNHTTITPEILNQITSQVIDSVLQQFNAGQFSPLTPHAPLSASVQMDTASSPDTSPPLDREKVYTPPSPYRASEEAAQHSQLPSPNKNRFPPPPETRRPPPSPPFSHATLSEDSDAKEGNNRKSRTESSSAEIDDSTIIEKCWGTLFDEQGNTTIRFSQFLRGIAVHLIEDYEPKHSLVITPDKMQKYYEETKQSSDVYPWQAVFDDKSSSISRMFREVEVQHHLVQDRLHERPDIPGMTPAGFETWMTLVLKAHPNEEFERLAYTALHMPVSNPDDRKERFPKELSRRQFPKDADSSMASRLSTIIWTHCDVRGSGRNGSVVEKENKVFQSFSRTQDMPPNFVPQRKPSQPENSLSQSTTRSSIPELDRNALRATVSDIAVEDSPIEIIPPPPIERERKPYVAQPGGGRHYNSLDTQIIQPAESRPSQYIPPPPKLTRSASLSNGRPQDPRKYVPPVSIHQRHAQPPPPIDTTTSARSRGNSSYHRDAPNRDNRNRSPSSTRTNEYPPKADGDVNYHSSFPGYTPAEYTPSSSRPENRYEKRASLSIDVKDRDREPRQRYHSVSNNDGYRYYNDDDRHRASNAGLGRMDPLSRQDVPSRSDMPYPVPQQFPPNSYRSRA